MTVAITSINVGTVADDGTGDTARVGGQTINTNFGNVKTAVETLQTSATNWDAAFGWGDHALGGYLTAETSHADVVVDGDFITAGLMTSDGAGAYSITTNNSTNWNTAFGWGNHASAGYLVSGGALGTPSGGTLTNTDGYPESIVVFLSDETTDLTTGLKVTIPYWPYAFTLTDIIGGLATAPTGAAFIGDVHLNGASIMTTDKLLIDATETTTETASVAPTLTTTSIPMGGVVEFYIDQIGSTNSGQGFSITFKGSRT